MSQRASGAVSCELVTQLFLFPIQFHLPIFSAPASSTTHHATLPFLLSSRQTRSPLKRCFPWTILPRLSSERSDPPVTWLYAHVYCSSSSNMTEQNYLSPSCKSAQGTPKCQSTILQDGSSAGEIN